MTNSAKDAARLQSLAEGYTAAWCSQGAGIAASNLINSIEMIHNLT